MPFRGNDKRENNPARIFLRKITNGCGVKNEAFFRRKDNGIEDIL
jgi:hypothetical protein